MLVKICGMRLQKNLDKAMELGCNFCGFVFYRKSPRYIEPSEAARLAAGGMLRTGVFVDAGIEEIEEIAKTARLDMIQLHGDYSADAAVKLGKERIIRVLWPMRHKSISLFLKNARQYAQTAAYYLLDAGSSGGTGITLDWTSLKSISLKPWFLAGGLSEKNIRTAISACSPDGVDINSGIELEPGIKCNDKMASAIKSAKGVI